LLGGLAQFIFVINFFYSMYRGKKSVQNPWKSNTIEWTAPTMGIHGNWPGEIPTVYRWPYDYSKPGHDDDFIPQTTPYASTKNSNLPGEEDHT
jgi:cytochrome c oxidase subunit 1